MKRKDCFRNVFYLIKLAQKYSPQFIWLEIIHGVIMGVFTSADVIFIKYFYEALDREESFIHILILIGVIIAEHWFIKYGFSFTEALSDQYSSKSYRHS